MWFRDEIKKLSKELNTLVESKMLSFILKEKCILYKNEFCVIFFVPV